LARPEEFDSYTSLGEHYGAIRRWSPIFLEAFTFESVPAASSLMRAIELLREMRIPTHRGQAFRFDRGHHSDLKPATIPT
jgi:hypothetical protein